MKVSIDTSVLEKLSSTFATKAKEVLWNALVHVHSEEGQHLGTRAMDFEEIIRHQKISQRKNVAIMEKARDVLFYLNTKAGKGFKPTEKNLAPIARLLETYQQSEILRVIDNKVAQWKGDFHMDKYLRPETLFKGKFDSYANEALSPEVVEENFGAELDSMLGRK